ncbi:tetratricopeptide repeat protein [Halorhodospira halochloris]|uniref:tetratricopeptide repeat protein n=1 Tax=Halorhodospira halochloris TaxID=1052 RepID=UPI001EE7A99A|nr:tetratricopeptide repeat protein [Halorhodospira halochloris]
MAATQTETHWQDAVTQIEELIDQGDYDAAIGVAEDNEQHTGIPEFDLAVGRAYLFAGEGERAARAFERVIIVQPGHDRARLELGRALYVIEDYETSRDHFTQVIEREPPDQVQSQAQRFVDAIDRAMAAARPATDAWVSLRGGHDNNVYSTSGEDFLLSVEGLEAFGIDQLEVEEEIESDQFLEGAVGGFYHTPWVADRQWRFSGQAQHRDYERFSEVDQSVVQAEATRVVRTSEMEQFHLGAELQQVYIDGDYQRTRARLTPEWRRNTGPTDQWRFQPVIGYSDYDNDDLDTLRGELGGSWVRLISEDLGVILLTRPVVHHEQTDIDYMVRTGFDVDANFIVPVNDWNTFLMALSSGYHLYHDGADEDDYKQAYDRRYEDDSAERAFLVGINFSYSVDVPQEPWRITAMINHRNKNSNIDIRNYEQTLIMADFRYTWE